VVVEGVIDHYSHLANRGKDKVSELARLHHATVEPPTIEQAIDGRNVFYLLAMEGDKAPH
jgi:hypothetical protein